MANDGVPRGKRGLCYVFDGLGAVLLLSGTFLFTWIFFLTNLTGMAWSAAAAALGTLLLLITHKLYPKVF